ncbi:MAG: NADH-quinone oxidoreductase subunit A [Deltaproteobacteria bacterium]|nr:NADH-quinone oxidoreductase subunit A [Deltaproteobacteria bacterium]
MLNEYISVVVMMLLCAGFLLVTLVLAIAIGPRKYSEIKDDPFECGTVPSRGFADRLNVKFYLVAMIFILFDVEIVFLYPWAVQVQSLGWSAFLAMVTFMGVLVLGLAYVWKRGVLDWT